MQSFLNVSTFDTMYHCIDSQVASAEPACRHKVIIHASGYAQMASLVCSWMAKTESHVQHTGDGQVADEVSHMQV